MTYANRNNLYDHILYSIAYIQEDFRNYKQTASSYPIRFVFVFLF